MRSEMQWKTEVLVYVFNGYMDWECAFVCPEIINSATDYTIKTISSETRNRRFPWEISGFCRTTRLMSVPKHSGC